MKKDHIRDYATEAFRYYAEMGQPTYEKLKEKYYQEALNNYERTYEKGTGIGKPTEAAVIYAENELRNKQAELWDILAVEKTLIQLNIWERQAVEIVYFSNSNKTISKCDIQDGIQRASIQIPASERSVYYYLKKARNIFAFERGLRK